MTCWVERGRTVLCNAQSRHSQAQSHADVRSIFESPDPWRVDGSIAAPKYAMGAHVVDLRCRCSFCLLPGLIISIMRCEAAFPADEMSSANRRSAKRLYQATRGSDRAPLFLPFLIYLASTGIVVTAPVGVARRPSTLICAPTGLSNSTVPRLPATDA